MSFTATAKDFSLQWDSEHFFNFFESEDAEIFAFGHVDPLDLLAEIRVYDSLIEETLDEEYYDSLIELVKHTWGVVVSVDSVDGEWRFQYGDKYEEEENAFPLTVVSR